MSDNLDNFGQRPAASQPAAPAAQRPSQSAPSMAAPVSRPSMDAPVSPPRAAPVAEKPAQQTEAPASPKPTEAKNTPASPKPAATPAHPPSPLDQLKNLPENQKYMIGGGLAALLLLIVTICCPTKWVVLTWTLVAGGVALAVNHKYGFLGGHGNKIDITISARYVPSMDMMSKSDPLAVVALKNETTDFVSLGYTEAVTDNENPDFKTRFTIESQPGKLQVLRVDLYDADAKAIKDFNNHDYIGFALFNVEQLTKAHDGKLVCQVTDKQNKVVPRCQIIVHAEHATSNTSLCRIGMSAAKLDKMDFFGKSDPYVEILRKRPHEETYLQVHQTEHIPKTLDPKWNEFDIPLARLNNGDMERPLIFRVWDWNISGKPELIGEFRLTANQILQSQNRTFELFRVEPKGPSKAHGNLTFYKFDVHEAPAHH